MATKKERSFYVLVKLVGTKFATEKDALIGAQKLLGEGTHTEVLVTKAIANVVPIRGTTVTRFVER